MIKKFLCYPGTGRLRPARVVMAALVLLLAVFLVRAVFLSIFPPAQAKVEAAPIPVRAESAARGDYAVYFTSLGTVTAANTVVVRSRVDGELMAVHFEEGQMVKAGDLLAEIDARPFQAQLEQARGQLLQDEAQLRKARQDLARSKILIKQDSTTKQDLDSNQARVYEYEGAVKLDQGQIDAAQLQIEYSRITAPISGKLGLRYVDAGNIISASDTTGLVSITQVQPINVMFTVTDVQLPAVREAQRSNAALKVEAWDRDMRAKLAEGVVVSLDNQIDVSTGTLKVKAEFPNLDDGLFPNQFVNAKLLVSEKKDACIVPAAAVQQGNQGAYVYVVKTEGKSSHVELRQVKTGPGDNSRVVILEGVSPGDLVVVEGLDLLGDKTPVEAHIGVSGQNGTPSANNNSQGEAK